MLYWENRISSYHGLIRIVSLHLLSCRRPPYLINQSYSSTILTILSTLKLWVWTPCFYNAFECDLNLLGLSVLMTFFRGFLQVCQLDSQIETDRHDLHSIHGVVKHWTSIKNILYFKVWQQTLKIQLFKYFCFKWTSRTYNKGQKDTKGKTKTCCVVFHYYPWTSPVLAF